MGSPTLVDRIRDWVGNIAWEVVKWSLRMTEAEYRWALYCDLKEQYESEDE